MQNNRKLQISTAGSRKSVIWPRGEILWSEFVEKLKNPVRGAETLEQYLAFPKSRQDELKDVGGFVGGTFKGDRRKACYVEGRDLLTLDLDHIPAGQTQECPAACRRARVRRRGLQHAQTRGIRPEAAPYRRP